MERLIPHVSEGELVSIRKTLRNWDLNCLHFADKSGSSATVTYFSNSFP